MLSLNEIKNRATIFGNFWQTQSRERAEKDTFWNEFFDIFGIDRKRVAVFEKQARRLGNKSGGFIDVFWKGLLICEHKSLGKDLDKAEIQATDYFVGLKDEELPRYIIVSDFAKIRLVDLETKNTLEFETNKLAQNLDYFHFLSGYRKVVYREEDPVNLIASELMGGLHDEILLSNYFGENLEIFLVRILFILFAEDTNILSKSIFTDFILTRTNVDGSDTGSRLSEIFQILNTPENQRSTHLDESLASFAYINGGLFGRQIPIPSFNSKMRQKLLECCQFDWSGISPAIFGSLFQYVMDKDKRREFGAHYTEEKNILKTISPLFLDDLWAEFERLKKIKNQTLQTKSLNLFHDKLVSLKFFDPACGCGNFLVITYREIRRLETELLLTLNKQSGGLSTEFFSRVDVNQFYGIEINEFASRIGETAMWLMDHIMNTELGMKIGEFYVRIPLKKAANIVCGNALVLNWGAVLDGKIEATFVSTGLEKMVTDLEQFWQKEQIFIIGNPPFVGSRLMSLAQKKEFLSVFENTQNIGDLDFVCAWYYKAGELMRENPLIQTAFVSTNSISQGIQVGILWDKLAPFGLEIKFAHQTFKWSSEARGKANVYCVIIGLCKNNSQNSPVDSVLSKKLYNYPDITREPEMRMVVNINPYLIEGSNLIIRSRQKPLCNVPEMNFGNMPADGGEFLFTDQEKIDFLKLEPLAAKFIKPFISAREFIHNQKRWCLWLVEALPNELRQMPKIMAKIAKVKQIRELSSRPFLADIPTLFAQITQPKDLDYILIPRVSSENRKYIPMGFFGKEQIASDTCLIIPNATIFHFGILTSRMHMALTSRVCGRLKSDFRYSKNMVYNNFPFPVSSKIVDSNSNLSKTQKLQTKIETLTQEILDIRKQFANSSLADLYDPNSMPPILAKTHQTLDKIVDELYMNFFESVSKLNPKKFENDEQRVEFLFEIYENLCNK